MSTYTKKVEDTDPRLTGKHEQPEENSLVSPVQAITNDCDKYVADLAFMNEPVEVMVLPSNDKHDTTRLVEISVNGKSYYLMRGDWKVVPRFVLEILVKTKKESWQFGYRKAPDGSTFETSNSYNVLRYPHHYRDANPKGQAWYDSIKDTRN